MLHVAPEYRLGQWLRSWRNVHYVTGDLANPHVNLNIDITRIPFPEGVFDAIICNHVLEHILDDAKAISELFRVLKPSGWAILQVPIAQRLAGTYEDPTVEEAAAREIHFGQADHVRVYAMDYVGRLRQAGFDVNVFHWILDRRCFGGAENRFALIEGEPLFIATRPPRVESY
jgi:SAM-dependent methyltransferase